MDINYVHPALDPNQLS